MPDIVLAAINAKWIHPCFALRLLKANLGSLEGRCAILEFALREPLNEKTGPLLAAHPRILGFSVSIWNHLATLELIEALENAWPSGTGEISPRPFIVLGGPEVSYIPENSRIFTFADWVIRGEGESAFSGLCHALLGLEKSTLLPGKFIEGTPADLAGIDPAYRLYSEEDTRKKLVYVEASRGCPFGCDFCLSSLDRAVRNYPLEPFLAAMDGLINKGARTIKFLDRSFNLDTERAARILEFFLERLSRRPPNNLFCVHFEMVPLLFPGELRDLIARFPAGSLRLEVGIQTFNQKTAAAIGRASRPGKELELLAFLAAETKAIVHADLIAGLPGENLESFGAGFDRLWKALSVRPSVTNSASGNRAEIQLGILKCLPGTPLEKPDEAWGMVYDPKPPYEVLQTGELPPKDLAALKNFARFWELIVNRKSFPGLPETLFPPGEKVFARFMELSGRLLARFGRNWGIERSALREALEEEAGS